MCGIAGIYSFKKQIVLEPIVKKMTNAMAHRGPDADGFFINNTVAFGHRRLSIIDLSENANQPIYDSTNNYTLIFNGEIYNYQEVKAKLKNYPFKTNSDTEVVLAAYITWGAAALEHFAGMFAFAIYNKLKEELFIARDRLGVKPLYYYKDENYFIFSSEIRAILATKLVPKQIDENALHTYFTMQSFYAPYTIVKNIHQLEAGTSSLVTSTSIQNTKYWDINTPSSMVKIENSEDVNKEVRRLLLQSVERRLVSDVPVAAFLSGGIDSSAIVALMSQLTTAPQTFNIAFNEEEYDESYFAEIIAKKYSTKHHKVLLQSQYFLDELPNALDAMDIPSGDGINSYVVSKEIAKQGIKVAMSGLGGDELFVGYPTFDYWQKINAKRWLWNIPTPIRNVVAAVVPNNEKMQRVANLIRTNELSLATFYPLIRQVLSEGQINNLLSKGVLSKTLIAKQSNEFETLAQFSIAELQGFTYNTLLKDTDQFSMAVSLEVREPFFDHQLIEYVLQVPDKYKKGSYPKKLLVDALGQLLPAEVVHRKKKGFTFPWENWMRTTLKDFCDNKINTFSTREFVNGNYAQQLWNNFLQKKEVRWQEIWLIVVLEHWLQKNWDN